MPAESSTSTTLSPLPIVILLSGNGSNLQAIIDAKNQQALPVKIRAVISNRGDAFGLVRAQKDGIRTELIEQGHYGNRDDFDAALQQRIDQYQPALVVLAGFMRILTNRFVDHYRGRIINIHPSLLPAFRGLNTHQRAIEANAKEHGATVHYVTPELDSGPAIVQAKVPVYAEDTKTELAQRVLQQEHLIFPFAIKLIAEGRLQYSDNSLYLDGTALQHPLQYPTTNTRG